MDRMQMMEYGRVAEQLVTRIEAQREIERHGSTFADFLKTHADQSTYKARTILNWLGY